LLGKIRDGAIPPQQALTPDGREGALIEVISLDQMIYEEILDRHGHRRQGYFGPSRRRKWVVTTHSASGERVSFRLSSLRDDLV